MIYLDMDGVVADFNALAGDILGREIGWEGRDLTSEEWNKLVSYPRFYYHLPLIPQGKTLVELSLSITKEVKFLTAIPRRTTMPSAEIDKKDWIFKYFPGIPVEFGPYSKDKQRWCKPGDILVDDKKSNVDEWNSRQGIAVHHLGDWNKTFENLKLASKIRGYGLKEV